MELPKIISVDDHVVEPPHVWQTWLPEKHREKGPRVERKRWGAFRLKKGAKYEMTEDPEGEWGDAWIYEDKVIDFILELANVTEKKVSKEELFKEDDDKAAA